MADPSSSSPLPLSVDTLLQRICAELKQQVNADARLKLASLGEEAALEGLHKVHGYRSPIRNLSGLIVHFANQTSVCGSPPKKNCVTAPNRSPSTPSRFMASPVETGVSHFPLPVTSTTPSLERARREEVCSPPLLALGELEFRKAFLILSYTGEGNLEDVISAEKIRTLKHLGMEEFESEVWTIFGKKYIKEEDRRKSLDWDLGRTHLYHCHVRSNGRYKFKGPFLNKTRTHLQKVLGDDNVLTVKFAEEKTEWGSSISDESISVYNKIAREGILVGLRRYQFFVFKDGGKEEKKKSPTTSPVKCYFVRMQSNASFDENDSYKLSGKTIHEARCMFMHAHTLPSVASYMARMSLILSKTLTLQLPASVKIEKIADILCLDENGNYVHDTKGKPLIHTDGTGFISEDLAFKCPKHVIKGNISNDNVKVDSNELECNSMEAKSHSGEPPLLMQFRLYHNGCAVKGTLLVNKKLPPKTIQIRPSMIKVESDPKLANTWTENSLEIVGTSNLPRRTFLSRNLIALLSYGGVPNDFFLELLKNSLEDVRSLFSSKRAALRVSINYGEMDDFNVARMILSGIPLDESYLQYRLPILAKEEKKGLRGGKIPLPESFYLMGTADPTGKLQSDEVCIILDKGQISGKVLVYRNPGLHFGDIHVLKATYVKELEDIVGNAKYGVFFPSKGPRSVGDEIAGGDFDGDMYFVSRNPQLLEHFKESKRWTSTSSPPVATNKKPSDMSAEELEVELFKLFMTTRFQPSYGKSVAADSWLAIMDRFLTLGDESTQEKEQMKENMLQLIDIYYDALDAPKKGGSKIEVPKDLKAELFPHYMERENRYTSKSILGIIYDTVNSYEGEDWSVKEVWKLSCFDVEVPAACKYKWSEHYRSYRQEMSTALHHDEGKNESANEVIDKYKQTLYGAAEFGKSQRRHEEIFDEAIAIYHICYDYAKEKEDIGKCNFAWKVAGEALCMISAMKQSEKSIICVPSVLREIFN